MSDKLVAATETVLLLVRRELLLAENAAAGN